MRKLKCSIYLSFSWDTHGFQGKGKLSFRGATESHGQQEFHWQYESLPQASWAAAKREDNETLEYLPQLHGEALCSKGIFAPKCREKKTTSLAPEHRSWKHLPCVLVKEILLCQNGEDLAWDSCNNSPLNSEPLSHLSKRRKDGRGNVLSAHNAPDIWPTLMSSVVGWKVAPPNSLPIQNLKLWPDFKIRSLQI